MCCFWFHKALEYVLSMVNAWDLANFTDSLSRLGKVVSTGKVFVPESLSLSRNENTLVYRGPGAKQVAPDREMLDGFVRLFDKNPTEILEYARKWGVLQCDNSGRPCVPVGDIERSESISEWRYFSRRARAVLNIAARLKGGAVGELEDWQAMRGTAAHTGDFVRNDLDRFGPFVLGICATHAYPSEAIGFGKPGFKRSVSTEHSFLMAEMALWLRFARIGFALVPLKSRWQVEIDYHGCLLAAIALQLALTLAGVDALFTCSACGRIYPRGKKRPKPGQENYCDNCGRSAALRVADRRRRARKLHKSGTPVVEIARRLNEPLSTLKGWLKKK